MSNSAQIVLDWLNKDLSLVPEIIDIGKEFSNGYLFGKIFDILKLISKEEFSEFIDSENEEDINSNFISLEKLCRKLFNLILFEKEINRIKEQHISAAAVLLYKIRNGVYKLNIHFNDIEFFGSNFSNDEIAEQIKDLIQKQLGDNEEENEKGNTSESIAERNINNDNDNIKEELRDNFKNVFINYKPKTFIKKMNQNINNAGKVIRLSKALPSISTMRGLNRFGFQKINKENNFKSKDNYNDNKISLKNKTILAPLNHVSLGKIKSNSTENIFMKNKNNIGNHTAFLKDKIQYDMLKVNKGTFYPSRNIDSRLIDVSYFNKKLEELGITKKDYKIKENNPRNNIDTNLNRFNETLSQKTNETIFKSGGLTNSESFSTYNSMSNIFNFRTTKEISNELKNNLRPKNKEIEEELSNKNKNKEKVINFTKIDKNFLEKNNLMKLYFKDHNNFSTLRRTNYSNELSKKNEQQLREKKLLKNDFTIYQSKQNQNSKLQIFNSLNESKRQSLFQPRGSNTIKEFDENAFFQNLSYQNYSLFKANCEKKYDKKRKISSRITEIVLFIVDMAMEGYIYQSKHKSEIMDLKTFLKFNIYFLKNKRLRKKYIPPDEQDYKRSGKIEQNIDLENLYNNLTNDDKNSVEDYIYYLGSWNDDKIYDNKLRGIKLDYKYITNKYKNKENNNNYFGVGEYEPTALEIEDLTLPSSIPDNYNLGNLLFEILSSHFNNNDNIYKNQNISQTYLNGQWDHIPYKISLIGYPLSGRKTLAKKLSKVYPNLKVYSIRKIMNYYFNLYLQLVDPVESPPEKQGKKKGKKNDKENENTVKITDKEKESVFEKYERQQKFKEMKSIFDSLKPFIDYKLNENKENDSNTNTKKKGKKDFCILPDESLCHILTKKIEEDFPLLDEKKLNKIKIDRQKSIKDMENQIQLIKKRKETAKKPNSKDDYQIEKLEKDIKNLKLKAISGFILVDYPTNINQCLLLENYLTGFIEEKRRPKSEKDNIIINTESIIDYKYQPKEKKIDKKSGLNFIINIVTKENIINERFKTAKYDPIEKILYTGEKLNIDDKSIKERLINKIPYLSKEQFEYYKEEYNSNINKIINLYSEFGFMIYQASDDFDFLEPQKEVKMIKSFYSIESEDIKDYLSLLLDKKIKSKKNIKKLDKNEIEDDINDKNDEEENINNFKIFNYICNNLIDKLHIENEKYEEELYEMDNKKVPQKNKVTFEPELNINEIKTRYKSKSPKKLNSLKLIDYENNKIDIVLKNLNIISTQYYKNLGIFISLMNSQKRDIFERMNLIQTKFRDYLNLKNPKKRIIISNYIKKYNHLYSINPSFLNNKQVISELSSDIEDIRSEIWKLISKKRDDSIAELNAIKHCGFIEVEFIKFYNNIKDLILNEAEKFLSVFNNMFIIYNKFRDKDNNEIINLINEYKKKLVINPEIMLKDLKEFKYTFKPKGDVKIDISLNEVIDIIKQNIELIFKNSIKMLFLYHNQLLNTFRKIKKSLFSNDSFIKKSVRLRKKKRKNPERKLLSASMMNDVINNKENKDGYLKEKTVKKMFLDEKNKFKFRICFIKNFAEKYIQIMKCTVDNIFENLDDWIVKNVTLQSESLSYLIKLLKNFLLHDKKLIDQESDIDYIELDEFEKIIDEKDENYKKNNNNTSNISGIGTNGNMNFSGIVKSTENDFKLKPFDNSSVINNRIYNKLDLNYLINDNFIDTKIEEIYEKGNIKNHFKHKIKFKIIPPPITYNSNETEFNFANNSSEIKGEQNAMINSKILKNKNNILKDDEFYFDLEKFKSLYKFVKKYEAEDGYINKQVFFEIFIKQYLISKKNYDNKKRKNTEDSEDSLHNKNLNFNVNYFYNEVVDVEEKQNIISNNNSGYPVICKALKKLNMKKIKRIYNCFGINIEKLNYINQRGKIENKKDLKKENDTKENKDKKDDKKISKRKNARNQANNSKKLTTIKSKEKTENKSTMETIKKLSVFNINTKLTISEMKKDIIEYNSFLSTKEIFTMLSLIGVNILTPEIEEKINKDLKNKLIKGRYLCKTDFLEYQFWFETFFEFYINEKIDGYEGLSGKKIIKEFLFDIWKNDENSNYFDFNKFFNVLKVNKYITDLTDFSDVRYYEIIFS